MLTNDHVALIMSMNPKRLVLIGDPSQLFPVGSGKPFRDLIDLARGEIGAPFSVPVAELEAMPRAETGHRLGRSYIRFMVARSILTRSSISSRSWNQIGTPELQGRHPLSLPRMSLIAGCSFSVSESLVPFGTVTLSTGCTPSRTSWISAYFWLGI